MKFTATLCFLATITLAPWYRGAIRPAMQQGLALLLVAALLFRLLSESWSVGPPRRVPITWFAAAAGLLLGLGQLVPLPIAWLESINPQLASWANAADAGDRPSAPSAVAPLALERIPPDASIATDQRRPVSLASALTRLSLAQLATACAAMLLAIDLGGERRTLKWILAAMTINGGAIAFVGIVEKSLGRGVLFWEPQELWFGPFVNRNNGAGYVVMSLGAALGLILIRYHEIANAAKSSGHASSPLAAAVRSLDAAMLATLAAAVLMLAAIPVSLSRGAMISLAVGVLTVSTAMLVMRPSKAVAFGLGVLLAGAVGIPAWMGMLDRVRARLETLSDVDTLMQEGRLINWGSGWNAAQAFLTTGSGLGTYRFAYRPFEEIGTYGRFLFPENAFLQTLVEAGIPGLMLFLLGLGAAAIAALRLMRSGDSLRRSLGFVGLFVLSTQAAHCCLDNGFYLPANFILLATLCGLFCGTAANPESTDTTPAAACPHPLNRIVRKAPYPLMLMALAFACVEFRSAAPSAQASYEFAAFRDDPAVTEEYLENSLQRLEQAIRERPDDAELRRNTAELYFARYRRQALAQLKEAYPNAAADTLWNLAAVPMIFAAACRAERDGDESALSSLISPTAVNDNLLPAWKHLKLAVAATPVDAESQLYLGELQFLVGRISETAGRFEFAGHLAIGRPTMLVRIGTDEVDAGFQSSGFAHLRRAWTLQPSLADAILQAMSLRVAWRETAEHVVPRSPEVINGLIRRMRERSAPEADIDVLEKILTDIKAH